MPIAYAQGFGHCPFGNYLFGNCTVSAEGGGGGGGKGGDVAIPSGPYLETTNETLINETSRRYDIIVKVERSVYSFNETVEATISIENKGDIPDEDTVLIYWLSNPINRKFGEAREQFLEVPVGKTSFKKSIVLPEMDLSGEWRFNIEYHTSIQSTINVFDSFTVKEELTFFDTLRNFKNPLEKVPLVIFVVGMIIIIYTLAKWEYEDRKGKENAR